MLTLKQAIGIVSLIAAIMACIAATLRSPSSTTELPGGLLFALTLALCAVGLARVISAIPEIDRFWTGFLSVCTLSLVISFSTPILSANTAPEHITRLIVRLRPLDPTASVHRSNERFYAMQGIVTNAAVLVLAVTCGLLAQRNETSRPRFTKEDG